MSIDRAELGKIAGEITASSGAGDQVLNANVMQFCGRFFGEASTKTRWLGEVPVLFMNVSMPSVAAELLQQWRDNPREDHDDVTVRNMDCWQGAIRRIATADVTTIPPDLLRE